MVLEVDLKRQMSGFIQSRTNANFKILILFTVICGFNLLPADISKQNWLIKMKGCQTKLET